MRERASFFIPTIYETTSNQLKCDRALCCQREGAVQNGQITLHIAQGGDDQDR